MIRFNFFRKIPVAISPFFWLTAAFIGFFAVKNTEHPLSYIFICIGVIFLSIFVHELGHAVMGRHFGKNPRIELIPFGGMTYQGDGPPLKGLKEFLVILNGPLFGFGLFLLASILLGLNLFSSVYILYTLKAIFAVNLYWTILNLLPVIPLDGGQLFRVICESIFKTKGTKIALGFSLFFSIALAVAFVFLVKSFFIGLIFFLFVLQNFQAYKKEQMMSVSDRDEKLKDKMKNIEELLVVHKEQEAVPLLEEFREQATKGILFNLATEYLAQIEINQENFSKAYLYLLPIKKNLSFNSKLTLFHAAYEEKDFSLVLELSSICFQTKPHPDIAFKTARACACLGLVKPAIGWLEALKKQGVTDFSSLVTKEAFGTIWDDPAFQKILSC